MTDQPDNTEDAPTTNTPPKPVDPHAHEPIYGQWFSKDGLGPDSCILRLWPHAPFPTMHPEHSLGHILLISFQQNPAPGAFGMGHCPYGAGPALSRDDVAKLHAMLGRWLGATAQPLVASATGELDVAAHHQTEKRLRRIIAGDPTLEEHTDEERMAWLDADPDRLADVRGRMLNEGVGVAHAIDWFMTRTRRPGCSSMGE